jgi:hypothetical protein
MRYGLVDEFKNFLQKNREIDFSLLAYDGKRFNDGDDEMRFNNYLLTKMLEVYTPNLKTFLKLYIQHQNKLL